MNESIPQDRSPRSPSLTLADSITLTSKLFDAIRTATVGPDIAVKPLGYGGTNGAAMTTLASLAQYGLVDRSGGKVAVTPLAIRILHPKGDDQREAAIREAALFPRVMKEIYEGYLDCAESVITGHLIQSGFNSDKARKVALIHIANKEFAKLAATQSQAEAQGDTGVSDVQKENKLTSEQSGVASVRQPMHVDGTNTNAAPSTNKVLAQYTIPLGGNQATLVFSGQQLSLDDFDALIEYVGMFRKQHERKMKSEAASNVASFLSGVMQPKPKIVEPEPEPR